MCRQWGRLGLARLGFWLPALGLLLTHCMNLGWSRFSQVERKSQCLDYTLCIGFPLPMFSHSAEYYEVLKKRCQPSGFYIVTFESHCNITMLHLVSKQGTLVRECRVRNGSVLLHGFRGQSGSEHNCCWTGSLSCPARPTRDVGHFEKDCVLTASGCDAQH